MNEMRIGWKVSRGNCSPADSVKVGREREQVWEILRLQERSRRILTYTGCAEWAHSRTAKGEAMMFLTPEDLTGMLDVVLFPDAYRQASCFIHSSEPLLVTGMMEMDAGYNISPLFPEKTYSGSGYFVTIKVRTICIE